MSDESARIGTLARAPRRAARPGPKPGMVAALALAAASPALVGAWTPCARAASFIQPQSDRQADPYENRPLRSVSVRARADDGTTHALEDRARQRAENNVRSYPGAPYRRATVDNDIRRLNRLGTFSSVESSVQLLEDGAVDLVFIVVERPIVQDVQVTGNTRLTDQDLAAEIDLFSNEPIDRFRVDRAARRIEDLYREKGYYFARVTIDEDLLEESGIVLFRIREGERVRVTQIEFEGNQSFSARQLARELETTTAGAAISVKGDARGPLQRVSDGLTGLLKKAELDDDNLDADIANLITFYRDRGHLDVRADRQITPSPNGKEAIVTYLVEEGPLYLLRSVQVQIEGDDNVFDARQIAGLIDIKPGDAYGVRALQGSIETVRDAYGQLGYADVVVNRVEKRDPDQPEVDLVITVQEGKRYTTGEVIIAGNDLTKQNVIRRQLEIRPERPLDTTAVRASETRLRRLGLFNFAPNATRLTTQPEDPIDEGYRDVLVEIEETNTSEFNIGGAVSSDAGVVGRIALTHRNFDIADTPDSAGEFFTGRAFRGAGQTFSLEVLPGDRVQTYSVSLAEPSLFESDYSGNIALFFRERDFDEYDERRYGARFGFGRRFGTRWNGSLNFRAESIELSDLEPDRPTDVFAVADERLLTTATLSLSRNTLDDPYRPTRGATSRIAAEQAGVLGGDFTYTKFSASHRVFVPLRDDYLGRTTTLSFAGEIGYVPQNEGEIPTYERFYLGGQSFRGFDFRTISPRGIRNDTLTASEDPVGGTWLFFLGAEVNQPIYEDVFSVVGFVDSGTVTNDPGFEDYRVSVGVGLRFYIRALSPAPLAFDFGFPIVKEDTDESRLFTFSIDLPF